MRLGRVFRCVGAVVTAGALSFGLLGCAESVGEVLVLGVSDAGGVSLSEAKGLSLEERFDLVGERYVRVQELMSPAQEQISDGLWGWGTGGVSLQRGPSKFGSVRGAARDNSYHFKMTRIVHPEGAVGAQADAEQMAAYFESQGWEIERSFVDHADIEVDYQRYTVVARTDDGYWLEYQVQNNGQYNLSVFSGTFWAGGEYDTLNREVLYRTSEDGFFPESGESLPGEYIQFPNWSDPKLWGVK